MARLLVTVWKLFGILSTYLLGTLAQTEVNTLHALFERIRGDPKNVNLQALSPLGNQLYLIAWDILYTVSFTGETIDSVKGRMNLNCKDSGSKWTQVPWLKPAVEKIGQQDPALVYMNIFVNPEGNQENPSQKHAINVIYRKDSLLLEQVWLNPGGRNINQKPILYGAVTTGALGPQAAGSKYQFQETPVPGIIVMGPTKGALRLPILAQDKRTVVFHKKMHSKGQRTLMTRLPVFGFIHLNVVHLWDTQNGHVVLFDNVPELGKQNSDGSDKNVLVRFVPFQDYFVCADESQNGGPVNLQSNSGNWFWIPGVFLFGVLIMGALGIWYYKFRQGKKAKKGSKVISSSLSVSSKVKPTKTTTSASSTTFSKLFATSKNSSSTIQKSVSIGSSLKASCTTKTPTKTPTKASGPSKTPKTAIGYKKIDGPHFDPKGKKVTVAIPSNPISSCNSQKSQVEFGPTSVYFKH